MITYEQALKHIADSLGYANMAVMGDGGLLCLDCLNREQDLIRACETELIGEIGEKCFEEETYRSFGHMRIKEIIMLNITSKIVDRAFQGYNAAQANGLCTLSWAKALDRARAVHAKVEKRARLRQLARERDDAFWASWERKANM